MMVGSKISSFIAIDGIGRSLPHSPSHSRGSFDALADEANMTAADINEIALILLMELPIELGYGEWIQGGIFDPCNEN